MPKWKVLKFYECPFCEAVQSTKYKKCLSCQSDVDMEAVKPSHNTARDAIIDDIKEYLLKCASNSDLDDFAKKWITDRVRLYRQ